MFEIYRFSEKEIILFMLMLIRISSCLTTMPVFGSRTIPSSLKILFGIVLTFTLFPSVRQSTVFVSGWESSLPVMVVQEAVLGAFLGFLCRFIFFSVEISGHLIGTVLGFNTAQILDPNHGGSSGAMEQFEMAFFMLLFLVVNGHYFLIEAIYKSFQMIPSVKSSINPLAFLSANQILSTILEIGVKLALPLIAITVILNISLGVIGRSVPQINVFITSFPVNMLCGFMILMVSLPLMMNVMEADIGVVADKIIRFLKVN